MPIPAAPMPPRPPSWSRHGKWHRLWANPCSLRRSRDERLVAGVAGGVAARVGVDPTAVRIGLVLMSVFGGLGTVVYVVAWLLVPTEGDGEPLGKRAIADIPGIGLAIGVFTAAVAVIFTLRAAGVGGPTGVLWPAALSAAGLVLVWRNAQGADREVLRRLAAHLGLADAGDRRPRSTVIRVLAGVALVVGGIGGVFGVSRKGSVAPGLLVAALSVIAGFVIVFGPWWLRLGRDLAEERRERVRSEERSDLAAHLHDSVLQTLALIQRSSGNQREVTRLARAQERELRAWLFEERAPGASGPISRSEGRSGPIPRSEGRSGPAEPGTVAAAVDAIERDVELRYGVAVNAVVVGDAVLDDDLRALLAATREAAVNAAKWSEADVVSLFAEVEAQRASVFVRDRGRGFDVNAIAGDRQGIRESIQGRIERRGGKTAIRSAPGAGTEVELVMPRRPTG